MHLNKRWISGALSLFLVASAAVPAAAQDGAMEPVPARRSGEGQGPYPKLVIRGAMMVPGDGGPARGPVDITVEGNRISGIALAGPPGTVLKTDREPRDAAREIDATGMWVLPGFIDTHGHNGDLEKAPNASYGYKLWLAHGVTSVRGVSFYDDPARDLADRRASAANAIAAPRLYPYVVFGNWPNGAVDTPERGRAFAQWAAKMGFDGIKFFNGEPPAATRAALAEAKRLKLGTVAHLAQVGVAQFNARDAGAAGLGSVTHFYGHFESLLKDRRVQTLRHDYNYADEQDRFGDFANLVDQIVEPGGPEWQEYLRQQLANGVIFNPTMAIYSASRDLMRARNADWHAQYTLPSLMNYFAAGREKHGSYWFDWTTAREVQWRRFYGPYMRLMNDYKNMGGLVTVGSDPGYIYQPWGFAYVAELELLQEAGFSPLEVIQSATYNGAVELYRPKGQDAPIGQIAVGKLADLVIVPGNPLQNLKLLYGTGFERLGADGKAERVGGVRYTVKDGVVYDAPALLADVAAMVAAKKAGR